MGRQAVAAFSVFLPAIIFLLRSFLSPYLFSFIRNNNSHLINK
ncbi:hypothetical protein BN130_1267 [Cronobacter malonaticus 507]|nr:hypothetical protein BN130_1267 [Cronobacter malonaticus 507]